MLRYCKETNERFSDILRYPVCAIFYVASYAFLLDKMQKEEYDKLNKKLRQR